MSKDKENRVLLSLYQSSSWKRFGHGTIFSVTVLEDCFSHQQREVTGIAQPGKGGALRHIIKRCVSSKLRPYQAVVEEFFLQGITDHYTSLLFCSRPADKLLSGFVIIVVLCSIWQS